MSKQPNPRMPEHEVADMFVDRWSPRAFLSEPIPEQQILGLFEAARWAPSCFNEQPWLFVYATTTEERERFLATLVEKNQAWARNAPTLIYILARRAFTHHDIENRYAEFDAGAAWMSLALQARCFGLYAHAMAGFNEDKARKLLGVINKEEYLVLAAVAVGRIADPAILPEDVRKMEAPNDRKPSSQVAMSLSDFGRMQAGKTSE